jgi:hypothetical protein
MLRIRRFGLLVPRNYAWALFSGGRDAQGHGNPKDVQAHLRHTDIGTTLNEYTQSIPESVRKLVNAVADEVMGTTQKSRPQLVARVQ